MVWAKNNYEPTYDEIHELIDDLVSMTQGESHNELPPHGVIQILPSMERYIWSVEGVYWSRRRVDEDGHVWFSWVRP